MSGPHHDARAVILLAARLRRRGGWVGFRSFANMSQNVPSLCCRSSRCRFWQWLIAVPNQPSHRLRANSKPDADADRLSRATSDHGDCQAE